ncbi:MAG: energy-coupling factor ABC transporter permease, partial [Deltaproteobacteria bacterium]|nr:energy-coupling factor ABC transporter permease [Deltaproteobacteria bacterium]
MHIPDGYLSPKTCVLFYGAMAPVWYLASRKASMSLKVRQLPMLALGAAFTFLIMMFNIPIPGGSSGHMVGTVVVSIVLGPWAGVVALSIALALQAFLFADGGILALGANCFNMAFLMSFTGYYTYRALTIGKGGHVRRFAASVVAGYI